MSTVHEFLSTSCSETSPVTPQRHIDVWPLDPRWNRVEWRDDQGIALGIVTFERRAAVTRPSRRLRMVSTVRLSLALANLWSWLKESFTCRLSTN